MDNQHFESLYPKLSREKEIAQIISFIKQGKSVQLLGIPFVGKSKILEFLAFNTNIRKHHLGEDQTKYHFVFMDLSEVRGRSLFDVNKYIFLSLADSLRDRKKIEDHDKLHKIFKDHLLFNDELVLFQGLKEAVDYLTLEKGLTMIFLFNNFEEYVPTINHEFFSNLRVLRNLAKYQFSAVFALVRPLEDILDPLIFKDFADYLVGNFVTVDLFDKTTSDFRMKKIEEVFGAKIPPALAQKIISLTGGHHRLMILSIEKVLKENTDPATSENEITKLLFSRKSIQQTLKDIWGFLRPSEQRALRLVLENQPIDDTESLEYLQTIELIKENKIAIPLLAEYLETVIPQKETSENIVFDPTTHEIKKGEIIISDSLTSSEFRMLSFMLQNLDKILEREEIINVVWKDTASTMGVTDQALDQLIFRIRRKIEDDPNHPTHLQTIKGRGFKFIS